MVQQHYTGVCLKWNKFLKINKNNLLKQRMIKYDKCLEIWIELIKKLFFSIKNG